MAPSPASIPRRGESPIESRPSPASARSDSVPRRRLGLRGEHRTKLALRARPGQQPDRPARRRSRRAPTQSPSPTTSPTSVTGAAQRGMVVAEDGAGGRAPRSRSSASPPGRPRRDRWPIRRPPTPWSPPRRPAPCWSPTRATRSVYYYKEGLPAPMGTFSNYKREPRAVLVLDREPARTSASPGVYETVARLAHPGQFDAPVLPRPAPGRPRVSYRRSEPDPVPEPASGSEARSTSQPIIAVNRVEAGRTFRPLFQLTDRETGSSRSGLSRAWRS